MYGMLQDLGSESPPIYLTNEDGWSWSTAGKDICHGKGHFYLFLFSFSRFVSFAKFLQGEKRHIRQDADSLDGYSIMS